MNDQITLRTRLEQGIERLEAYSLRERVLLLLCVLAILVGAWQLLVEMPREQRREQIEQQRETVANDIENQRAQLEALASVEDGGSPSGELRALEERVAELDESLASLSQGLVSAEQLPEILQEVLVSTTELKLRRLRTLPVEELRLSAPADEPEANDAAGSDDSGTNPQATGVYRHSVELEVAGDYFEVLSFLQRLESLPWRFYWDRLEYEVSGYPLGEIRLRVYTLSAEEGLLGV